MTTRPDDERRHRSALGQAAGAVGLALLCALPLGCQSTFGAFGSKSKDDAAVRQMSQTDDVHGPLERFLRATGWSKSAQQPILANPAEAVEAYQKAEDLLNAKQPDAAIKAFKAVAKRYKRYPIREDALFMIGECQFKSEAYAKAQDSYDTVIKEYPATRHLDDISRRKFKLAQAWLGFPDIITSEEVQPVNFQDIHSTPVPKTEFQKPQGITYAVPILPNLTDHKRPLFDTQGRALEALKSIWLNDPTGPLADDALMLSASHHLRNGDYVEADRLYDLLRKEFPKSRHLENAFVLGGHCKLMSYQGAPYDGTDLEEARKLRESTIKLFPKREDRERLLGELRQIEEAKAAREWADAEYWNKKRKPKAVAIKCKEIIKNFPETSYAQMAREQLAKIDAADKRDIEKTPYDERKPRQDANAPGPLDEPDTPPQQMPAQEEDSGRVRL